MQYRAHVETGYPVSPASVLSEPSYPAIARFHSRLVTTLTHHRRAPSSRSVATLKPRLPVYPLAVGWFEEHMRVS